MFGNNENDSKTPEILFKVFKTEEKLKNWLLKWELKWFFI